MKRYYPILVAILMAGGIAWYVLSGKTNVISSTSAASNTASMNESTFLGSTPTPLAKASQLSDGTHTGKVISTDYGDIQIALVVSGGKITAVNVLKQPDAERRSVEINTAAIPQLKSEVLTAQSSNVDAISGASFTSEGFLRSLQSAFVS